MLLCCPISIHAPARGATRPVIAIFVPFLFQSTLPRGERRKHRDWLSGLQNFNPRSREGSDIAYQYRAQEKQISIHAPARGATSCGSPVLVRYAFQSTLPRGERLRRFQSMRRASDFNPRSREGSDSGRRSQ